MEWVGRSAPTGRRRRRFAAELWAEVGRRRPVPVRAEGERVRQAVLADVEHRRAAGKSLMRPCLAAGPLLQGAVAGAATRDEVVGTQRTAAMVLIQRAVAVVLTALGEPLHQPCRGRPRPQPEGRDEREQQEARPEVAESKHGESRTTAPRPTGLLRVRHADASRCTAACDPGPKSYPDEAGYVAAGIEA